MPTPVQYREEDNVRAATARLATLQRRDRPAPDPEVLDDARDEWLAARLERAIHEATNPTPPTKPLSAKRRKPLVRKLRTEGLE